MKSPTLLPVSGNLAGLVVLNPKLKQKATFMVELPPMSTVAIRELIEQHAKHPTLYTPLYGYINQGVGSVKFLIAGDSYTTFNSVPAMMHVPMLAAYIHLLVSSIENDHIVLGDQKDAIVFSIDNGKMRALAAGILKPNQSGVLKQKVQALMSINGHEQLVMNAQTIRPTYNTQTFKKLFTLLQEIKTLYISSSIQHNHMNEMLKHLVKKNGDNMRNNKSRFSNSNKAVSITSNNRKRVLENYEKNNNNNAGGGNGGGNGPSKGRANGGGKGGGKPSAAVNAEGVVHSIGKILEEHGGNNANNKANRKNINRNIEPPNWMRLVYGPKRARALMQRRYGSTNNTDGSKSSPISFRTMTFIPLPSFIPRQH
jgi:hypothetical protein